MKVARMFVFAAGFAFGAVVETVRQSARAVARRKTDAVIDADAATIRYEFPDDSGIVYFTVYDQSGDVLREGALPPPSAHTLS